MISFQDYIPLHQKDICLFAIICCYFINMRSKSIIDVLNLFVKLFVSMFLQNVCLFSYQAVNAYYIVFFAAHFVARIFGFFSPCYKITILQEQGFWYYGSSIRHYLVSIIICIVFLNASRVSCNITFNVMWLL